MVVVLSVWVSGHDVHAASEAPVGRSAFVALLKAEASKAGLPFDVGDAVMAIESGYDPTKIGGVGEIGLMQVRPETAAMLGFKGDAADLARPEVNIHYGVTYLAGAWHQADGDLCRALMKYRAGHGQERMTPLSVTYCSRARAHLASLGSPYWRGALAIADAGPPSTHRAAGRGTSARPWRNPQIGMSSGVFWAAHTARVARVNAQIERRWKRMASR